MSYGGGLALFILYAQIRRFYKNKYGGWHMKNPLYTQIVAGDGGG
jgi:hypothetical protein